MAAAETAEGGGVDVEMRGILIDVASEQEAPVGELIGIAIAIVLLTLLFRSLAAMAATHPRRADRRHGRPDPADDPRGAARPARVRLRHRGHARPRRRHRLLPADHRALPRAGGRRRHATRRLREGGGDVRRVRGRRRPDRHGRDRRPARDRHPVHRQARHRGGDRRRRGGRLGADDPPDHDRRVQALAAAEEAGARGAVALLRRWGEKVTARRGSRSRGACSCCSSSPRR